MRRAIFLGLFLTYCLPCGMNAQTALSPSDSLDQISKFLEQEYRLLKSIKKPPQTRLSAAELGLKIEHTIIEAKLLLKEHGEIETRAGLCLEYLNTGPKNLSLTLAGGEFQVGSVLRANADSLEYVYDRDENLLRITIPASAAVKDTLWITYFGEFALSADSSSGQPQTPIQEMTADYAYALGGLWFPSLPDDIDLQTVDIHLSVPEGFVAVATGDSTAVTPNADSTVTFSYSSKAYGPVYNAGSFSVARYKQFSKTIGNVKTSIYSLERQAWNDNADRIGNMFDYIEIILGYYHDLYGGIAYPWKELKITEVGRNNFLLGVADLEWTILPQSIFNYYPDSLNLDQVRLLAHEIAHQWWGMKVTPDPAQSPWLAEGMAEYSAKTMMDWYIGSNGMATQSPWEERKLGLAYSLSFSTQAIANPNAEYNVVYEKGAWVARMLEQLTGEQSFKTINASFLAQYSGKSVSLEEYSAYWQSQAAGVDLSWFFGQWFYKPGVPVYITRGHKVPQPENSWQVSVTRQSNWDLPVEIGLYYPGGKFEKSTQRIDQTRNEFVYTSTSGLPDSVRLDPENKLLSYNMYPPNFRLTVKPNTINVEEPAWVAVLLDSLFPQHSVALNWRVGEGGFQQLDFDFGAGLSDTVFIPAAKATARVDYYLEVKDTYGQSFYYPDNAPDSLYSYYFTEYDDLPEGLVWASFSKIANPTSGPGGELSIFDLESGLILHTYPDAGGYLNISPNNMYLVSDDYRHDELVVIDLSTGRIASRLPYSSALQPQMLAITGNGRDVFMSATLNRPGLGLEGTYHILVENKILQRLDKAYNSYEYNPLDNKLYMKGSGGIDVLDIATDVFIDSIPMEKLYNFSRTTSLTKNYRVLSEIIWGGANISGNYNTKITLNNRNLMNGNVFETLTLPLPELGDDLRTKVRYALLLPNSTKTAFLFKEEDHFELNFWDIVDPTWHRNVVLEGSSDNTEFWEMKTDITGKKLVISNVSAGTGPCLAVVSLETYQVERYLYPEAGRLFSLRFETENPPYNATINRGDANLDGRIDIFDLLALLGNLSGKNQSIFFESDLDGNGRIDIFDLLGMLKLLSN